MKMKKREVHLLMDDISVRLLDILQNNFPVESRPFLKISHDLGIDEDEVIDLIGKLKRDGYIRRIGGVFDSKKLGYFGTLCAMRVPENKISEVSEIVNSFTEVTHNYIRTHKFNMWFTITAFSEERISNIIRQIKDKTEIEDIMQLNSLKSFKIKVKFDVGGKCNE
ncbi:MAG: Lrp/AsnC family transcriptional regulator [Bacillota bacterium]